ncbi:MAG: cytochrome C [Geobacteraceae bacterium GWC2_58_44]|nr:MAG: cytochrome C [Geobacteraceae bacterium GWC2_58_44]
MKSSTLIFPILAMAGLIISLAACAQLKALPSLPPWHPEALEAGRVSCTECHEKLSTFNHTTAFVKDHRFYASSDNRNCAICHKSSFCNDCHTNQVEMKPSIKLGNRPDREMPHRGDFTTLHKIEGKLDPASCRRCHGRANNERCIICHR